MIQLGFVVDFICASIMLENSEGEGWRKREKETQRIRILCKNIKTSLYNLRIVFVWKGTSYSFNPYSLVMIYKSRHN